MIDPYFYEDFEVLKNKLDIKDGVELDKAEVDYSCNAIHELSVSPLDGNYDFKHFCDFHAYIFKDVYEWAGQPRTVDMEKEEAMLGYMSIEYAKPKDIVNMAVAILDEMNGRKWGEMSSDEQTKYLSNDMARLWKVHAFREGNTRTTITYICQFADSKGIFLDRDLFKNNSAYTRQALVAASAYFSDGNDFSKKEYLYNIVRDSIERGSKYSEINSTKTNNDSQKRSLKSKMEEAKNIAEQWNKNMAATKESKIDKER